jgi:hypothetical protein
LVGYATPLTYGVTETVPGKIDPEVGFIVRGFVDESSNVQPL